MRKFLLTVSLLFFTVICLKADEGMWLVNGIDSQIYKAMKKGGVKIKPQDIYSPDKLSIKDAIVALDGGSCSGSIISQNGLLITNHHCAYSDIHTLSTPQHNYLEDGFWAFKTEDEIPVEGKTIWFLKRVVDVTEEVNVIIDSLDSKGPRGVRFMSKVERVLQEKIKDCPYEISLGNMWKGNFYYLYFYEIYKDIRLVAAPPVSVGAYGGEQDNWNWPQHKGDFAMYRVYASKDGKPASYSKDNVPLVVDKWLKVSTSGVNEGDYTMILGYPGSTNRYISAAELTHIHDITNPISSTVRRLKLSVMAKHMEKDPLIRLKYADEYFGTSNYCDYAKWGNKCIGKYDIIGKRKAEDEKLTAWINADANRVVKYGNLIADIEKAYNTVAELDVNKEILRETMVRGTTILIFASRMGRFPKTMKRQNCKSLSCKCREVRDYYNMNFHQIFKDKDLETEKDICYNLLEYCISNMDRKYMSKEFIEILNKHNWSSKSVIDEIFDKSFLTDSTRFNEFFSKDITESGIENDPLYRLQQSINVVELNFSETDTLNSMGYNFTTLKNKYVDALYHMRKEEGKTLYPNANSTMRFTYGNVCSIEPADGVYYHWQSTSDGIVEKFNKDDYEYNMKDKAFSLIKNKDFGRWAVNGKLPINFLSNNDITGGNSGSAVLNAKGELVGLAFDGNREAMSTDYYFDPRYCKCVNVDIRYVLWILDKYAGTQNILDEIGIK